MKIRKIDIREIEGFKLGSAENAEAGTGVTVIVAENGAVAGVDVRGGGPATRETDLLRSENTVDKINAVVLSGGSAFGLEAASGVMRELSERGAGFRIDENICVPIVPAASLYDLSVGQSDVFPDVDMGREAVSNAYAGIFEEGCHGAGTGASVGKYLGNDRAMKTGVGTFACGDDVIKVGAIAAVNAVGDVYNGAGNIIAGLRTSDGSSIQGTIRILKGMVHGESSPEINLSDIKTMAAAEALTRQNAVAADVPDVQSDQEQAAAENDPSDIVRAMMATYEQENAAPGEPAETAEDNNDTNESSIDSLEISDTQENTATYDNQYDAQDAVGDEEDSDAALNSNDCSDPVAEDPGYTEAKDGQTYDQEPEAEESVDDAAAAEDEYVLSEEDRLDMGYDIPFNTTISCLITNAVLTKSQANKLASILHDAYARAIKPVHGTLDGDTVFVMSTCEKEVNFDAFAALATDVMQYAIIDGASSATGAYGLPAARDIIHR